MKTKIFRSTAAAMIAAAAVLATCAAAGETVTSEPDALLDYIEATGSHQHGRQRRDRPQGQHRLLVGDLFWQSRLVAP